MTSLRSMMTMIPRRSSSAVHQTESGRSPQQQQQYSSQSSQGDELIVGWPQSRQEEENSDYSPTTTNMMFLNATAAVAAATTTTTNARGGRSSSVSFAPHTMVQSHLAADDMTSDELDATWYTDAEYKKIKKEARATLQYHVLLARKLTFDPPIATPQQIALGEKLCLRGLEHMRDADTLRERRESKDGVVEAVLVAQEEGFDDESYNADESIANACMQASRTARALATNAGAHDQEFVNDLRRREHAKFIRRAARRRVASGGGNDGSSSDERPHVQPFGPESPVDGNGDAAGGGSRATKRRSTGGAGRGFRSAYQQVLGGTA